KAALRAQLEAPLANYHGPVTLCPPEMACLCLFPSGHGVRPLISPRFVSPRRSICDLQRDWRIFLQSPPALLLLPPSRPQHRHRPQPSTNEPTRTSLGPRLAGQSDNLQATVVRHASVRPSTTARPSRPSRTSLGTGRVKSRRAICDFFQKNESDFAALE